MGAKNKYRIRNWSQYNQSLIQRGSLTVWFSEDAISKWSAPRQEGKRGRPHIYSDEAILTVLMIRSVFHLPLRALQGFILSLVTIMGISLMVPSYTQICRRARSLGEQLARLSDKKITDIVADSTGLKVYGEGEWKVRKHGASKRRTWRKLHLAVCPESSEIIMETLTENSVSDDQVFPNLMEQAPESVERVYGDGAYDKEKCYKACAENSILPIVPPSRDKATSFL